MNNTYILKNDDKMPIEIVKNDDKMPFEMATINPNVNWQWNKKNKLNEDE